MKAMVLTGHGGLDKYAWHEDWPMPEPGPMEALIKVGACGLNNTDVNTRTGWYSKAVTEATTGAAHDEVGGSDPTWGGRPIVFPRIQGADAVGEVVAVGASADPRLIGQRVMVDGWQRDWSEPENMDKAVYFGSEIDGGFAEYTTCDVRSMAVVNSVLTDAELATFSCSYTTARTFGANYLIKGRFSPDNCCSGTDCATPASPAATAIGRWFMPKVILTDARVKALHPRKTTYDIRDGKLRGFGVRVLPSGRKRFFVHSQHRGDRVWKTLGDAACCSASPFDLQNRSESTCYHANRRPICALNNTLRSECYLESALSASPNRVSSVRLSRQQRSVKQVKQRQRRRPSGGHDSSRLFREGGVGNFVLSRGPIAAS